MYRNPQLPSLARRLGISLSIGLVFATVGAIVEATIEARSLISMDAFDDLLIGFLTAGVIFAYEQRRYRTTMEKIQMISAMNHHVRNALQVISYSPYTDQEKQIKVIAESVSRIEWALREILPGEAGPANTAAPEPGDRPATASSHLDIDHPPFTLQQSHFSFAQVAPLTGLQCFQPQITQRDANQPQRGMSNSSGHPAHLAIATFR